MLTRFARVLAASALATTSVLVAAPAVAHAAASGPGATGIGITEVAPWGSGNSPYAADWFELTNFNTTPVTVTGWRTDDNSTSFSGSDALTGITTINPGQSVVYIQATAAAAPNVISSFESFWFPGGVPSGFTIGSYTGASGGLGTGGDAVNVWNGSGVLQARVDFGASPAASPFASFDNAAGVDTVSGSSTISGLSSPGINGAFAVCSPSAPAGDAAYGSPGSISGNPGGPSACAGGAGGTTPVGNPWPGGSTITPAFDGTHWVPEAGSWSAGKSLKYPDGSGDPDAEAVTLGGPTSADGVFVGTERDNDNNTVSKKAILRYDPNATGSTINATGKWDITSDVPSVPNDQNLGIEGLAWVPDTYLVANGLTDSTTGQPYNPASYPNHGNGLFFAAIESTGIVYGYALDLSNPTGTNNFTRVTSFATNLPKTSSAGNTIAELSYDADGGTLMAWCDDACSNTLHDMTISPTTGTFAVAASYLKPAGMPAGEANEGFTIAPNSECVNDLKPAYWADDSDDPDPYTGSGGGTGYSVRAGTITCENLASPSAPPSLPEFPSAALALLAGLVPAAGVTALTVVRRSRRAIA